MSVDPDQISLSETQRQLLASAAAQVGLPWEVVFSQAVAAVTPLMPSDASPSESRETAYEKLVRLGLIGSIEGTPPDLSTNKAYLADLGRDA